jgi:hypothetical protein
MSDSSGDDDALPVIDAVLEDDIGVKSAAGGKKVKRKKKKKPSAKRSEGVDGSSPHTVVSLGPHLIEQYSPSAGRFAAAASDIPAGAVVLLERAIGYALTASPEEEATLCALCIDPVPVTFSSMCDTCGRVTYCSSLCRAADEHAHALSCAPLQAVAAIARATDMEATLLKLIIAVAVSRSLLSRGLPLPKSPTCPAAVDGFPLTECVPSTAACNALVYPERVLRAV